MTDLARPADGVLSPVRDPLDFIAAALESKAGAEELDKLIKLHERVTKLRAEQAFAEAMNACQTEMPVIVKDGNNTQTNSRYARLESIMDRTRPVYLRHGFAPSFAEADCPLAGFKRTVCDLRHVGGHCVRYHVDLPLDGFGAKGNPIGSMNPVQAAISTGSYAQRVLFVRMFGLVIADTDLDGRRQTQSDADLAKQEKQLEGVRTLHAEVYGPEDDDAAFWSWVGVEPGHFADIPPQKLGDVLTNLKRKLAQKRKAVTT